MSETMSQRWLPQCIIPYLTHSDSGRHFSRDSRSIKQRSDFPMAVIYRVRRGEQKLKKRVEKTNTNSESKATFKSSPKLDLETPFV